MKNSRKLACLLALVAVVALGSSADAAMVQKMDLAEVCDRADTIFRGTVLSAREGTMEVGGGTLPTMTYTIRVADNFQGKLETKGDTGIAEITTLGRIKRQGSPLANLPVLEAGRDYLLMMTPPSAIGLSAPVGLSQGCYTISGKAGQEIATDGAGNSFNYVELVSAVQAAAAAQ